jgi:glucose-6-phosphate-specific signal transduction histidine kinase
LPLTLRITLYRFVQEGLANVRNHTGAASAQLRVGIGPARAEAEIRNPRRGPIGTGNGLTGLRERVELLGGDFRAGPIGDEWVLSCSLPVAASETA